MKQMQRRGRNNKYVLIPEVRGIQDAKTRSKHSGEDVIYGMGGLIRTQHVYTYIHTYYIEGAGSGCDAQGEQREREAPTVGPPHSPEAPREEHTGGI